MENEFEVKLNRPNNSYTDEECWEIYRSVKDTYQSNTPKDIVTRFQDGAISVSPRIVSILMLIA